MGMSSSSVATACCRRAKQFSTTYWSTRGEFCDAQDGIAMRGDVFSLSVRTYVCMCVFLYVAMCESVLCIV
jgi:hypothetical protein